MTEPRRKQGVRFHRTAYVGFWRRAAITVVDGIAVVLASIVFYLLVAAALGLDSDAALERAMILSLLLVSFVYLVVLKRTRLRTIGYRLFRARIVDLTGARPGLWSMTQRYLFLVLGPLNYVFDLVEMTGEETRQTVRDLWAGTYVIRCGSKPESTGEIALVRRNFLGGRLLVREVRHEAPPAPNS